MEIKNGTVYVPSNHFKRHGMVYLIITIILIISGLSLCIGNWNSIRTCLSMHQLSDSSSEEVSDNDFWTGKVDAGAFLKNPLFRGKEYSPYVAGVNINNSFNKTLYCYSFIYNDKIWEYYIAEKDVPDFEEELNKGPGHMISISGQAYNSTLLDFHFWFLEGPTRVDGQEITDKDQLRYSHDQLVNVSGFEIFLKAIAGIVVLLIGLVFYLLIARKRITKEPVIFEYPVDGFMINEYDNWDGRSRQAIQEKIGDIRALKKELGHSFEELHTAFKKTCFLPVVFFIFLIRTEFSEMTLLWGALFMAATYRCIKKGLIFWANSDNGIYNVYKRKIIPCSIQEMMRNCDTNMDILEGIYRRQERFPDGTFDEYSIESKQDFLDSDYNNNELIDLH